MAAIVIVGGVISAIVAVVAYLDRKSLKAKLGAAELRLSATVKHDASGVIAAVEARERLVRAEAVAYFRGAIIAAEQEAEKVKADSKADVLKVIGIIKAGLERFGGVVRS